MYAVVNTGGRQQVVKEGEVITIDRRNDSKVGDTIELGSVLLVKADDKVHVGKPEVAGAKVTVEVLGHLRGKKLRIFKMKKRKGYRRTMGHRQDYTRVKVSSISL